MQAIMGGTNMNSEQRLLDRETPDILTATPGRLLDHLQNASLLPCLSSLQVLIFDEADRLLDMGFRYCSAPLTLSGAISPALALHP